jgi:hypothetical protein
MLTVATSQMIYHQDTKDTKKSPRNEFLALAQPSPKIIFLGVTW